MQNEYKTLFLRQSYLDCSDSYAASLRPDAQTWDYVVLTASNDAQAKAYEAQIEHRLAAGVLPQSTTYAVVPDPEGKRCGSGGATLAVLRYIAEREGKDALSKLRILCIHSGGDSKRVPQYSACGKIFSPVPRTLPDGRRSTLFDEFMYGMSGVPSRIANGLLVCSGDVLLLFNALQLDFYGDGAAALSIKEKVQTGKNHGVFLGNTEGNVERFLHKQSVETLETMGAVDKNGNVDIDTGAVIFSGKLVEKLYTLVDTPEKFDALVNDHVRLSFYADFLYPLAKGSTLDAFYNETPEGDFSPELRQAREQIWNALHGYPLKLVRFSPAAFLHFGTTNELRRLMTTDMPHYRFLGWTRVTNSNYHGDAFAVYNSYIGKGAAVGNGCYVEDSDVQEGAVIGDGAVVSGVTLLGVTVPADTVLHGLKLSEDRYVCRMYSVNDNPKENTWMGKTLSQPLWETPLFKVCPTMEAAVKATLNGDTDGECLSLKDSFNLADVTAILPFQDKLDDKIIAESILEAIDARTPCAAVAAQLPQGVSERVERYLLQEAAQLDETDLTQFSRKIRIYYYASKLIDGERLAGMCFDTICNAVLKAAIQNAQYDPTVSIKQDEVVARLPVRVNWGGGWTDTPPHCLEHGGTVLNAALLLDGDEPIEVTLRRLPEHKFILASTDIGSYSEFTELDALCNCNDPHASFALHKAALIACGVIPREGGISMQEVCRNLGGGLYMNTRVINIPKGSGLGTSSILAAACVKGLSEFLGLPLGENDLINRVLCMEQLMSTGGGWQDQVGGLIGGVKLAVSEPALEQQIRCRALTLSPETERELGERFAVIYTGQRRLARNLLREVVGKYIGSDPVALDVLGALPQIALEMCAALENGDVDRFAQLLNAHWEQSKRLDAGCTNTCIDQIFLSIDDLIDGRMICGAGGGGFLQVVMKRGVTLDDLAQRLDDVFADSGVRAYRSQIVF
ncbi:MAG: bifunctional fucokinase/L-fucose-1-P-guanylyltransferase [Clostridia bacterium]|nr:bifunctional fucokinase/L-fucose-1-P-guanylyltransferase [Clostridia bacterium]